MYVRACCMRARVWLCMCCVLMCVCVCGMCVRACGVCICVRVRMRLCHTNYTSSDLECLRAVDGRRHCSGA